MPSECQVITLDQFVHLEQPDVKWLVPGILPRPGLTVLLGAPFSGKSFLALQLALDLAQNRPVFGRTPGMECRVLYLQLDTSTLIWRDRLVNLADADISLSGPVMMPHPSTFSPPIIITEKDGRDKIKDALDKANPDVVIVDVLRELHQFDENDSTSMKRVGDAIQSLFGNYCTIILHHAKKLWGDIGDVDPINACRGSSYITGKADAIWLLSRDKIKLTSRFSPDVVYPITRQQTGFWDIGTSTEDVGTRTTTRELTKERVILLLLSNPALEHPISYSHLYETNKEHLDSCGISRSTYFRLLHSLGVLHGPNSATDEETTNEHVPMQNVTPTTTETPYQQQYATMHDQEGNDAPVSQHDVESS